MTDEELKAKIKAEMEPQGIRGGVAVSELPMGESSPPNVIDTAKAYRDLPQARLAPNGIFRHPSELTDEEMGILVQGIRARIPLYKIAWKLNCERGFLTDYIKKHSELGELWRDQKEAMVDDAEHQIDRLVNQGNPAAVMFVLERKGHERGWGGPKEEVEETPGSRIVFGEISDLELNIAQAKIEEAKKVDMLTHVDPVELAGAESAMMAADIEPEKGISKAEQKVNRMVKRLKESREQEARTVEAEGGFADGVAENVSESAVHPPKVVPFVAAEPGDGGDAGLWDDGDYGRFM